MNNHNTLPYSTDLGTAGIGFMSEHGKKLRRDMRPIVKRFIAKLRTNYDDSEVDFILDNLSAVIYEVQDAYNSIVNTEHE